MVIVAGGPRTLRPPMGPEVIGCADLATPIILSPMANHTVELDAVLTALADPTRRAVIRRLAGGPASVGELAAPFPIALPTFLKHVRALESSGLIRTRKSGRIRTCALRQERLTLVQDWLDDQRHLWESRTDRLEQLVTSPTPTEEES